MLRLLWTHDCFEWIELSYWMLSTSYTAPGAGPDGRCQRLSKNQWLSSSCSVFSVFAPRVFVAPGFRICTIQADFTKQIAATYMYTYKSHRKPWFQMFPANFSPNPVKPSAFAKDPGPSVAASAPSGVPSGASARSRRRAKASPETPGGCALGPWVKVVS